MMSQLAAEFLQAQFAGQPTESAANALGREGASAVGDTMVAVIAAVEALARCQGLRTRWSRLVHALRAAEDPTQPTSLLSMVTGKIKAKVSLLSSVTMSSVATRLGLIAEKAAPIAKATPAAVAKGTRVGVSYASAAKKALEKKGAAANTATLLSNFRTKTHTQSFKRRREGPSEGSLMQTAKARTDRAPQRSV
jgi:hypothetical protein